MKSLFVASLLIGAVAQAEIPANLKCRSRAELVVRKLLESKTLVGGFSVESAKLFSVKLPLNEEELQEVYQFQNSGGDNTLTLTLAQGLCELRSIIHNVPL